MAFFPCSVGRHPFRGPASHLYPARVNGIQTARTHLRLCTPHFDELLIKLEPYVVTQEDDYGQPPLERPTCGSCHQPMEALEDAVFVTAYPRTAERLDFYFRLHSLCRMPIGLEPLLEAVH